MALPYDWGNKHLAILAIILGGPKGAGALTHSHILYFSVFLHIHDGNGLLTQEMT